MKNLILLLGIFCASFSSCKKEEPFVDPNCNENPIMWTGIDIDPIMGKMALMPAEPDRTDFFIILNGISECTMYGEKDLDSGWSRGYTAAEWELFFNTADGAVVCGGMSYFTRTLMREANPQFSWGVISLGEKNNHMNQDGHMFDVLGIRQDSKKVYAVEDTYFNQTVVYKNDTTKLFDFRDILPHALAGTLHQVAMIRKNTKPGWFLTKWNCISRDHPAYDPELGFSIYASGRTEYPYLVYAPRSGASYIKYWVYQGRNFSEVWTPLLLSHGITFPVDWSNPDHAVYMYACYRGLYDWSDEETKTDLWPQ